MTRSISDLCLEMIFLHDKFTKAMHEASIDFITTCTYRSNAEQDALYAQGRTKPGRIVTNAKAGQTKHNCVGPTGKPASEAFDIAIMKNGAICWNAEDPLWDKAGKIGESLGMVWGGSWKSFKDKPHFELKKEH